MRYTRPTDPPGWFTEYAQFVHWWCKYRRLHRRQKLHTLGELSVKLKNAGVIGETLLRENHDHNCNFGKKGCMAKVATQYTMVVFSSFTCPECHHLLELLTIIRVKEPHIIELGAHYNIPGDVRDQLTLQAGTWSVPSLFVGGESIRGYANTKKYMTRES